MRMIIKLLLWTLAIVLVLVASGWLLADWLQPRAVGVPSQALPAQPDQTDLDRAVAPLLLQHPGQSGAVLVNDGLTAFAVRAMTARSAGRSLDLQYYIWHDDITGRLLAREAWMAADRGVRVRLLLDDLSTKGSDRKLLALDAHPNIELRVYNPLRNRTGLFRIVEMVQRSFSLNHRMHNKAWIADGRVAVVGGRNVGVEYFDASHQANFHDLDAILVGPVVDQASAIFDRFWNSEAVVPIQALVRKPPHTLDAMLRQVDAETTSADARRYLDRVFARFDADAYFDGTSDAGKRVHWSAAMQVLSDPPDKRGGQRDDWLMSMLQQQLASANHSLQLISPYFVPGPTLTEHLTALVAQGRRVGIITNSLAANDVLAVHSGYRRYRTSLLQGGVTLHELRASRGGERDTSAFGSSGASLHTKAFLVDGQRGFIGSFNLDPRSAWLNTEMGLLFHDAGLGAELAAEFDHLARPQLSYAVSIHADGSLRWQDGSTDPPTLLPDEPQATAGQRAMVAVLDWLPIESQL